MKKLLLALPLLAALSLTAPAAKALSIGTISCTAQAANKSFTSPISSLDILTSVNVNVGAMSGQGSGRATFAPLVVHVSPGNYASLFPNALSGTMYSECTIATTVDGTVMNIKMKLVAVQSVTLVGSAANGSVPARSFVALSLVYGGQQVVTTKSGPDDGGTP